MLMVEVYKSLNHHNPSFLWGLFARKEINYNLRIKDILLLPKALTTSFGTNSISFRGSLLWNSTPDVIKSSKTVFAFIKNIKNWSGEVCNFIYVVFIYNFVAFCSCSVFSISWYLLVLLISTKYFSIQL